ncbi:amidohydrolase family protein [Enterovibrio norvegicus]|uniref:amidohydrolase family protein n=1 Tax=Enterovibrio norvegicus TaxID=188144 RepID=UPI000C863841|nr:amidohydrolase family protein [Enterovibrio norvegicus]PML77813.1 4-oxalomesaconate hydratase [Enterovibrio norvegicus]
MSTDTLIIDCHGHYTTAPNELGDYRDQQKAELAIDPLFDHVKGVVNISDDQIRDSLEGAQLKLQNERGTDVTIFSPRASWMGHHIGNQTTSKYWTEHCNELIHRIAELYPQNFIGAAQLPQSPEADLTASAAELERCVKEFGFVGCNLSPDPSGGYWTAPPLDDKYYYPVYEKMCELDVPAMIHVSGCCHPCFHTTGSHYLGADTTAFQQLMMSKTLFKDFPELKFIVPHGGGAVPYHWGRFRGLCDMMGLPPLNDIMGNNIFFDTCVYHQEGIDLLLEVVPKDNILFASEMIGAVRGIDPQTGNFFDDTKRYIDGSSLSDQDKAKIFNGNTRQVFSRLDARLKEVGLI